jgi:hypothetical protein
MTRVRRFVLAIVVALLTFSVSGASALVLNEPCTGYEQPAQDDRDCPPTCVTCGCCAQAVEAVIPTIQSSLASVREPNVIGHLLPRSQPREILHVPKPRIS